MSGAESSPGPGDARRVDTLLPGTWSSAAASMSERAAFRTAAHSAGVRGRRSSSPFCDAMKATESHSVSAAGSMRVSISSCRVVAAAVDAMRFAAGVGAASPHAHAMTTAGIKLRRLSRIIDRVRFWMSSSPVGKDVCDRYLCFIVAAPGCANSLVHDNKHNNRRGIFLQQIAEGPRVLLRWCAKVRWANKEGRPLCR